MDIKEQIQEALTVLKKGGIILYPTDTVWGIGCDATNEEAVARIFAIKQRNDSKSLITLAADMNMVAAHVKEIPEMAEAIEAVNDKPLTIIYPQAMGLADNVPAEDGSIAIRIPRNNFCIGLIRRLGRPIVSTSANISGTPAPTTFDRITEDIKEAVDFVADPSMEKGATRKPSSIIKLGLSNEVQIIRE